MLKKVMCIRPVRPLRKRCSFDLWNGCHRWV